MKHINLSSWKGSITDWTELNYIYGGLDDVYADVANIQGNYVRKGINIWDEEWERGYYNINTGVAITDNNYVRSKNNTPIKVNSNTDYYFYCGNTNTGVNAVVLFFDENDNFISSVYPILNQAFTTPLDCSYIKFYMYFSYGSSYANDIMITLGTTAPSTYEPYSSSGLVIEDNQNNIIIPIN